MNFNRVSLPQLKAAHKELARHLEKQGPNPKFSAWCKAVAAQYAAVTSEITRRNNLNRQTA